MARDLAQHPCFNDQARHRHGRVHLPVAPHCNVQCNFCNRRHDCVNESRPGVASCVLSPGQALHYLRDVVARQQNLAVVGIAGPGDPFASADETLETLRLVHGEYPDLLLCVASNGLALAPHVPALAELAVSHVTITVNAVDAAIGAKIYAWVRAGKRILRGEAAGAAMWAAQSEAIGAIKAAGITVKINTIIIPGVNDAHVPEVAQAVAELGADVCNCIAMYPVAGTPFQDITPPAVEQVAAVREQAGVYLPLMHHCTRCRADAVGLLGAPMAADLLQRLQHAATLPLNPRERRPFVAVASHEGVLVNQHLGEAARLLIYQLQDGSAELVDDRPTPAAGSGTQRWEQLSETLHDCRALLVASAGESPRQLLARGGVRVVMMEGLIEEGLQAVYAGQPIRAPLRRELSCGSGCAGDGTGCGG